MTDEEVANDKLSSPFASPSGENVSVPVASPFELLQWHENNVVITGREHVVFLLGQKRLSGGGGTDGFIFDKSRRLIDQYDIFWRHRVMPAKPNVLELGIHDGAGIAFWTELLHPSKCVGVDIAAWGDSPYFAAWAGRSENRDRVRTYWNTDQADQEALRTLCTQEFEDGIDIIIDDASHLIGPTQASFDVLFPFLRPGGLYIIEDWSWGHWPNLRPDFPLPQAEEPTSLVANLVSAVGDLSGYASRRPAEPISVPIQFIIVQPDLVVVERGTARLPGRSLCEPQVPLVRRTQAKGRSRWIARTAALSRRARLRLMKEGLRW